MSTAYKVEETDGGLQIIREKDNKVMANVVDGNLETTAAAYNRASILDKLVEAWSNYAVGSDEEEESGDIELEATQTVAGIDAEDFLDVVQADEEVEIEHDELTKNIHAIIDREGAQGVVAYIRDLLGEKDEQSKGIDFSQAPACNPSLGDRTPEFMQWLRDNHPAEAIKRYGSL